MEQWNNGRTLLLSACILKSQYIRVIDSFPLDVYIHLVGAVWWKGLSPTVSSAQLQQFHPPNIPSAQQPPTQDLRSQVS